jgi:hypothetical protein
MYWSAAEPGHVTCCCAVLKGCQSAPEGLLLAVVGEVALGLSLILILKSCTKGRAKRNSTQQHCGNTGLPISIETCPHALRRSRRKDAGAGDVTVPLQDPPSGCQRDAPAGAWPG